MNIAAAVFAATFLYWVEIKSPEPPGWTHVHGPDWETTDSAYDSNLYAHKVLGDYPAGTQVRVVERPTYPADMEHPPATDLYYPLRSR